MWQPIESAPRDGTWVLLWCPKGVGNGWDMRDDTTAPYVTLGKFEERYGRDYWESVECYTEVHDYGGYTGVSSETHAFAVEPTHWMPLPEPPA